MNPIEIIGAILLLIASIFIIVAVMMQETKQAGMNTITGGSSDTYVGRKGAKTKEAFLNRLTKICAITFFIVSLALNIIVHYVQ